jgi:type IV pilus assembly protein PilM
LLAVQKAGLQPAMVDLTSFAVLRSLYTRAPSDPSRRKPGRRRRQRHQHRGAPGRRPALRAHPAHGRCDITDAVAERLGVPTEQAEAVKQTTGLAISAGTADAHPASRAIEQVGRGPFVEEVRGSLDYYAAQPSAARIGKVVLSGGGSRLGGLAERLRAATRLPVEVARPMSALKLGKTGLTEEQLAYVEPMVSVPVGLAMGMAS